MEEASSNQSQNLNSIPTLKSYLVFPSQVALYSLNTPFQNLEHDFNNLTQNHHGFTPSPPVVSRASAAVESDSWPPVVSRASASVESVSWPPVVSRASAAVDSCPSSAPRRGGGVFELQWMRRRICMSQVDIISNALFLSQDPYGNYVIQSLIEKEIRSVTSGIINQLRGRFISLSLNKYGSYVVEKCIRWSSEMDAILIIKEIIYDRNFLTVLQDAFGNYVAQSALAVAKGSLRKKMVYLILKHQSSLRNHPHGKRILAKARALKK